MQFISISGEVIIVFVVVVELINLHVSLLYVYIQVFSTKTAISYIIPSKSWLIYLKNS